MRHRQPCQGEPMTEAEWLRRRVAELEVCLQAIVDHLRQKPAAQ